MAAPKKVDWSVVRNEYLQDSTVSYSDLAKKYGVSLKSVKDHGAADGWPALRQNLSEKAFEAFTHKLLGQKSDAQERHLRHYQNIQALANKSIAALDQANYYTEKGKLVLVDGKPVEIPPDPYSLKALAQAIKLGIDGERVVLGLPTAVTGLTDGEGKKLQAVAIFDLRSENADNDETGAGTDGS